MAFLDDTQVPPARSRVEQLLLNAQGGGGSDSSGDSGSFDLLSLPYVRVTIGVSGRWDSAGLSIYESYSAYNPDSATDGLLYELTNESHLDGTFDRIGSEFVPNNPVCILDVQSYNNEFYAADRDLHLVDTRTILDLSDGGFSRLVSKYDPANQMNVFYMLQAAIGLVGQNEDEQGIFYEMTPFDSSKSLIEGSNAFYSGVI